MDATVRKHNACRYCIRIIHPKPALPESVLARDVRCVEPTATTSTTTKVVIVSGRAHGLLRPYGLTGQYWERLGETFIDVVLTQEAVRDLPGAGQAWVIFTACVVDQLRAGFEESRLAHQMFTRREEVLHHATMHLYETCFQFHGNASWRRSNFSHLHSNHAALPNQFSLLLLTPLQGESLKRMSERQERVI
ncbi:unnamed protein product [Heligmosomoides polygyrus]|uniref:Uncharacterized protein n=1 Tax=Heligmosomoides polygyrus TaxID=6339 RepID=A0A183G604_HELPZ|nr:unnamed protein product [Heligmosomoides polygyrus]